MYYLSKRLIRMWRARRAQRVTPATAAPAVAEAQVVSGTPRDDSQSAASRGPLALLLHEAIYDLKISLRNPRARFMGVFFPIVLLTGRRPELVYTIWGRRNTLLTGIVLFVLYWVRLLGGPVDIIALVISIPTLVPTALLHFVALFRRVAASPRAR